MKWNKCQSTKTLKTKVKLFENNKSVVVFSSKNIYLKSFTIIIIKIIEAEDLAGVCGKWQADRVFINKIIIIIYI